MRKLFYLFSVLFLLSANNTLQAEILTNTLDAGKYYIKISDGGGGYLYLTHTGVFTGSTGNQVTAALTFKAFVENDATSSQVFTLAMDGAEYKITCNMNGTESFMQENLLFQNGLSRYNRVWHTHRIFYDTETGMYAGRAIGSSGKGKGPWTVNASNQFVPMNSDIDPSASQYVFYIEKVNIVLKALLVQAITDAETFKSIVGSNFGTGLGQYGSDEYSVFDAALSAAKTVNGNSAATQAEVDAATSDLNTAKTNLINSYVKETNLLLNGDYYILLNGFFVSDPGSSVADAAPLTTANNGLQATINIDDATQIFTIARVSGIDRVTVIDRYTFFNGLSTARHLNENAQLRSSFGATDDLWRSQNIYYNGNKYAIQAAGSSAPKGLWYFKNDNELSYNGIQRTPLESDYTFELIPVAAVFAGEIAKGRIAFNAATKGSAIGEYNENVYNAFETALETAEANINPAKEDLFAYAAAVKLFVPNVITGIDLPSVAFKTLNISSVKGGLQIGGCNAGIVSIYSIAGQLVKQLEPSKDRQFVALPEGMYVVNGIKAIVK